MSFRSGGGSSSISGSSDTALSNPSDGQFLVYNASTQKWSNAPGATTAATASTLGTVKLAGDLSGTASAPVVANGVISAAKLDSSVQSTLSSVSGKLDAATASTTYATKASPTFSGTVTLPSATPTAVTQAASKGYVDTQIASVTSSGEPDATASTQGIVRLAGDLSGTSAAPTVPGLTNKAAKGANSDITSLTGLTTALSVSQGGTGATSATAALGALGALAASQKAAASGVASLDGATLVPRAQLGTGTATSSTVLYGDGAWRSAPSGSTGYVWTNIKTSAYTAASGDAVICDASSSGFTVTLPSNLPANAAVRVKKIDGTVNAVIVASPAQIDNGASYSINNQYASQDFSFTGTTWYAV